MDRAIVEERIEAFERHLREEEREAGTIEKYLRDVRGFAGWRCASRKDRKHFRLSGRLGKCQL